MLKISVSSVIIKKYKFTAICFCKRNRKKSCVKPSLQSYCDVNNPLPFTSPLPTRKRFQISPFLSNCLLIMAYCLTFYFPMYCHTSITKVAYFGIPLVSRGNKTEVLHCSNCCYNTAVEIKSVRFIIRGISWHKPHFGTSRKMKCLTVAISEFPHII